MLECPDILVLGGGGRQGDAWMTGVLAGIEDAHGFDLRECGYFVGTSAGAVVATKLAAGRSPRRPSDPGGAATDVHGSLPSLAANSAMALAAPFTQIGLRVGRVPGEMFRSLVLRAIPATGTDAPDFHNAFPPESVRFDGRLRVVAVDRSSGRRVVFGAPGGPPATVAQALTASCALPLVFAPAVVAGRQYVDGATWSPTNADVSPVSRDARVLILAPTASLHGPFNAPVRAASRAALLLEAGSLTARGARLRFVAPDRSAAASIGHDLMLGEHLQETHAAGYAQGLSL